MKYVIIGASAAAINTIKGIRSLDQKGKIVLVSKDTEIYSRCLLHHLTSGERSLADASFVEPDFINKNEVTWKKGLAVTGINTAKKTITLENQEEISYDKLLIATGAKAVVPPVKNLQNTEGVHVFRDLADALSLKEGANSSRRKQSFLEKIKAFLGPKTNAKKKAIVLGAGLVGLDAAYALLELEVEVTIVERLPRILYAQLDGPTSERCADIFREHGASIYTSAEAKQGIVENGKIKGLELASGQILPCDLVIVAAGVRSNVEWINEKNLIEQGKIPVNQKCETNLKDIYAAGDVTGSAIWPIASKMGYVSGINMAGGNRIFTGNFALKNSMHFWNFTAVSLGMIEPPDNSYAVEIQETKDSFRKIIHKDGKICGAIILGDLGYCGVLQQLIAQKIDINKIDKSVFDIGYGDFFQTNTRGEYYY